MINEIGFKTKYKLNSQLIDKRKVEVIHDANNKLQELKFDQLVEERLGLADENNFMRKAHKQ